MGPTASRILGHAFDGLRNVSAGVLASQLAVFIQAVASSGWASAAAAINPASAAVVISVATVLNFVRQRKSNLTAAQVEQLTRHLQSLTASQKTTEELLRGLAPMAPDRGEDKQVQADIDAVLNGRFDELDETLAQIVADHLIAAGDEREEIRQLLGEFYQTVRLFLNQADKDLQVLKEGQEALLSGQAEQDRKLDRLLDGSRQESIPEQESISVSDITAQVAAELLPPIIEKLQTGHTDLDGVSPQQATVAEATTVTLTAPPLVPRLCERESTVSDINQALGGTTWLALRGDSGAGKTQLAALVVRQYSGRVVWVRLRDFDSQSGAFRLDACFQSVHAGRAGELLEERIRGLHDALDDGTVLVLDDLPSIGVEDPLGLRLLLLAQAASGRAVRLLSTSLYALPSALTEILHQNVLSLECPAFTDSEIVALLRAHGAPVDLAEPQFLNLIRTVTHAHPVLLVAAMRYLQQKGWQFTNAEFDGLLRGQYARLIAGETLDRLIVTVANERTRDLLYRLKLIVGEFSADDVNAVASVDVAIDRPAERLHALTGLWIQREAEDQYTLSPLVRALPDANLPADTQQSVHDVLGTRIVQRRVLDPWDVMKAISHFQAAERYTNAALLLLQGLRALLDARELGNADVLLLPWCSSPIPSQVSPAIRVFLRAHQIEALARFGRPTDFILADIRQLIGILPDEESWALVSIVAVAGKTISQLDPILANRVFLRVIRSWRTWRGADGQPLPPPEDHEPEALLWMTVDGLKTREHVCDWLNAVRQLEPEAREKLFADEVAKDIGISLASCLSMVEARKADADRDWDAVISALDDLVAAADEFRQPYLKACAVRAKITIKAEYDLRGAVEFAEATLAQGLDDPRAQFVIRDSVARAYVFAGDFGEARRWFAAALAEDIEGPKLPLAFAYINASRAFGDLDANEAVEYAEKAVEVAGDVTGLAPDVKVRLLGELAIAQWLAGNLPRAFLAFDEAADILTSWPLLDSHSKGLYMYFGHVCGYLAPLATTGSPPASDPGGEVWLAPERGFFFRDPELAADRYVERRAPGVFVNLVRFAEGVGSDSAADKWAARGREAAHAAESPGLAGVFAHLSIAGHIARGEYETAIDLGLEASRGTTAALQLSERGQLSPILDVDAEAVLQQAGDEVRVQADRCAAMTTVLPIAMHLATDASVADVHVVERAERLIRHIEELAANSPCSEYWNYITGILRRVFVYHESAGQLYDLANQHDDWFLRNLAYLGSTLCSDIWLANAVRGHVAVLSSVGQFFDVTVGLERRIVVPFVQGYWRRAFDSERFRFSAPSDIDRDLRDAEIAPVKQRTRATVKAVMRGLSLDNPDYAQTWLRDGPVLREM